MLWIVVICAVGLGAILLGNAVDKCRNRSQSANSPDGSDKQFGLVADCLSSTPEEVLDQFDDTQCDTDAIPVNELSALVAE